MDNRLDRRFAELKRTGRKAFVSYLCAGDPTLEHTPALVAALDRAGSDVVELGLPFSDPLADGVVNQLASQRALDAGATPHGVLAAIQKARETSDVPIVLYAYVNLIFAYGVESFAQDALAAGVDGVLLLDLPPEEDDAGCAGLAEHDLKRICLVAPTTPRERIAEVVKHGSGFIYYVSREGVTGMQSTVSTTIGERVALIRAVSDLPVCVGFGISNPEQAKAVASEADGVVVGSALVSRVAEWSQEGLGRDEVADRLETFARPFAEAVHAAGSVTAGEKTAP
ncbi:MAG: tryptophan synthase subunit alpha [Verrucomicrobiota bacterium]